MFWWLSTAAERLQRKARAKRAEFEAKWAQPLPPVAPELDAAKETKIALELSIEDLVALMQDGTFSSHDVVSVLAKRAREFGGPAGVNALTDVLFEEAFAEARRKDRDRQRGGGESDAVGVLEGIPLSVKDHIDVKGTDSTTGAACRCFRPASKDALVVELLRDAGAIVLCKTNVPQCLMLPETSNNIWGVTSSPWNLTRSAGGSSGGEAALVAVRGSLVGIGTDIGGSCRGPAHFSGCVGFKPTPARVSGKGIVMPSKTGKMGMQAIKATAGPLANRVEDVALVCQAWWVNKMWARDPYVVPLPFDHMAYRRGVTKDAQQWERGGGGEQTRDGGKGRQEEAGLPGGRKIRLGWFVSDDFFEPCRAGKRAVREAKQALESTGKYELVEMRLSTATDGWEAVRLYYNIMTAEGGLRSYIDALEGEAMIPMYRNIRLAACFPDFLRPLLHTALYLTGEKRRRFLVKNMRRDGLATRTYWQYCEELQNYQEAWTRMLQTQKLDGFLCPSVALPAFPHGWSSHLESSCSYNLFLNLLHYPAGVIPVTQVRADEAVYPPSDLPRMQRDSIARAAAIAMQGSEALPVSVQVAFPPFQDEMCLHVMKDLQDAVGFTALPPYAKRSVFK